MKFAQMTPLFTAALWCGFSATYANSQQASPAPPPAPATTPAVLDAASLRKGPPLSEEELRARYVGKLIFLRGSYLGDELNFDKDGKISGSPAVGSFTLSAFEVRKVTLSKNRLELEADRYGLHYLGALPFEDDSKAYDQVKISKKPVHISIEREVVIVPKVKKEKKKKEQPTAAQLAAAQTLKSRDAATPAVTATAPPQTTEEAATTAPTKEIADVMAAVSATHSAVLMNKALDNVFASDMDPRMMSHLPDYWQEYFASKKEHRAFMPADRSIRAMSDGMTPPKVLNSIDPSSNEYAQQYGIAGMELLRTVVNANGVVTQTAISRPIGFGLDEKAVEAVRNSHFKPAMVNGQPVPVVIDLVVTFRIYSNRTKPGSVTKDSKEMTLAASVADSGTPKDATLPR